MVILNGINKELNGNNILIDINLELLQGSKTAIVGANGSGKSMLLRIIAGLMIPSSGEVTIRDQLVDPRKPHPVSVGVMIEQPGFWLNWTGYENLAFLASLTGKPDQEAILELLKTVGLEDAKDKLFRQYSMGMKQRLAIAQALMDDPELLVLDEPTNGLDDEGSALVLDLLEEQHREGKTIIMTSHINEHLNRTFDAVYRMNSGRIADEESV